jgi:hypothetical protein
MPITYNIKDVYDKAAETYAKRVVYDNISAIGITNALMVCTMDIARMLTAVYWKGQFEHFVATMLGRMRGLCDGLIDLIEKGGLENPAVTLRTVLVEAKVDISKFRQINMKDFSAGETEDVISSDEHHSKRE